MSTTRRAVVFDFGAVLFRWKPLELLQQVIPNLAVDEAAAQHWAAQIFQSFDPQSDWSQFDLGQLQEEELVERLARRTGAAKGDLRRLVDAIADHLLPMPDSVALFWRFKQAGYRLYDLSNMPMPYARLLQKRNEFIATFDAGVFSCDVAMVKPDKRLFEHAQAHFGLKPEHTLFIDDHPANVQAAQQLGWLTVHFVHPAQAVAEIDQRGW